MAAPFYLRFQRILLTLSIQGCIFSGITRCNSGLPNILDHIARSGIEIGLVSLLPGATPQATLLRPFGASCNKKLLKMSSDLDNIRPWGFFEVLSDAPDHKVKRITVFPGKRLSLQRHQKRSEHWHIVKGIALMTLDDREFPLQAEQSVDIPCGSLHRIANPGQEDVVFIEIQRGDYFGEDDIERLEDDFGRV